MVMVTKEDKPFFTQRKPNYGSAMESNDDGKPRSSSLPISSTSDGPTRAYTNIGSSSSNSNNNARNSGAQDSPSILYCLHGKSKVVVRDHCHRQRSEGVDITARKKLIIASVLCLFFMICEIIGGILSNSLAIATDAAHLLTDFASFMISLFAIWIAGRPSTQRMSFGWYRAEVIGALASVVMIWFITAILVWLAVERLINQNFEVDAKIMLITSGLAILVNLIMGCQLQHGHTHGGGHGHAHGAKKTAKGTATLQRPDLQCPTSDKLSSALSLDIPTSCPYPGDKRTKTVHIKEDRSSTSVVSAHNTPNTIRPNATQENIENGNAGDLVEAETQMPAAGLQTYSYQNSISPEALHAEMSAVMAETSLGGHHHGGAAAKDAENINVRAAYIHVLGDIVQSVGVFVAALVIYFRPDWVIVDPICTFFFSIIVLITTFGIMKDALLVLMEGTPSYLHYTEVLSIFQQIEGVERVHNLRIWALSINKIALSVHLAIAPNANPKKILQDATTAVHLRYNFFETTIQIEDFTPQMENCQQCTVPDT